MKNSAQDNVEGKVHRAKGKIKEVVGRVAGNRRLEAEGKSENFSGKVQEKVGEVKKTVGK